MPSRIWEKKLLAQGYKFIAGIDEATNDHRTGALWEFRDDAVLDHCESAWFRDGSVPILLKPLRLF